MSNSHHQRRGRRHAKHSCRCCGQRRARYAVRGNRWRCDAHHDLCRQCWQSAMDSVRAHQMAPRIIGFTPVVVAA